MEFVDQLVSFVAATSGMKQEEVAALVKKADGSINTDGVDVFAQATKAYKAKLAKIAEEGTSATEAAKTTAHNAGLRNGAEKVEKAVRERLKIESELSGDDLLKAVEGKLASVKKGEDLTQEMVEASPFYITGVNTAKATAEAAATKAKEELDTYKKEVEERELYSSVLGMSQPMIDELNLDFSEDASRAKNQRDIINDRLKGYKYQTEKGADGNLKITGILDADGKLAKDEHGNPLTHQELVKRIGTGLLDIRKGEKRSGDVPPGAKDKPGDAKGKWTKPLPTKESEYLNLASDQSIPLEERLDLTAQWEAANPPQ